MPGDLADVPLQTGDVLVVQAGPEFLHNFKHNRAFSLISEVPNSSPMKRNRMWIALLLTLGMVATQVRAELLRAGRQRPAASSLACAQLAVLAAPDAGC